MKKWSKIGMLAAMLAVVLALGLSASAFAQGPGSQHSPAAYNPGSGVGMSEDHNRGGPQNSLVSVAARVLGMSQSDLVAQLDSKTIADIAKEKHIATDNIVNEFLASRIVALKGAVASGQMTQAQADQVLATMKANVTEKLNRVLSELRTQKLIRKLRMSRDGCLSLGDCLYRFFQSGKPMKERSSLL